VALEASPPHPLTRAVTQTEAWWVFPTVPLLASAVAFTWMLHAELERAYGMTALAWDLAYYQQLVWEITQGHGFYTSFQRANFLGVHLEPILLAIAAVEKLWPSPVVLMIFGAAGLAATGPAAYLFFRAILPDDQTASRWLALALATPIPFWAAIQEAATDFFHPENMALPMALLAAWAGVRGRRAAMWSLCVLTLCCKEDQVYTIGVLALLMRSFGAPAIARHWRFILYLAGAWFLLGTGLVQQYFRDYGYTDFVNYRWLIGLDPNVPVSGLAVLESLFSPGALVVVAGIVASLAALPLLAPRWSLLVIPPYLANVLSEHVPQNTLNLHYALLLIFPMIVAAGVGGRRLIERRTLSPATSLAAMLPALIVGFVMGTLPPSANAYDYLYTRPNAVAQLMQAAAVIPAGAPVNADSALCVWLANRDQVNDFPDKLDASSYVVIDKKSYLGGPTDFDAHRDVRAALPGSGRSMLYDDGRFQVWSPVSD
jgi:uncharacterized membrane protein